MFGKELGRRIAVPAVIVGLTVFGSGCSQNSVRDVEFNPVDCSGQTKSNKIELFLGKDQSVEVFGKKLSAPKPGTININQADGDASNSSDVIFDPTSGIMIPSEFGKERAFVKGLATKTPSGQEGTILQIDVSCSLAK